MASSARDAPRLPAASTDEESGTSEEATMSDTASQPGKAPAKAAPRPGFIAPSVWMVAFGVALATCAGTVDVVTSRSLSVYTSHVTGTVARIGMRLEGFAVGDNDRRDVLHSMLLVLSFICGSFVCGLVIPKNQVHFGGKSLYGLALLFNSGLLIAATFCAPRRPVQGDGVTDTGAILAGCLAAMACGLQNAMCTMHFGAVVRTTHVTGTATDIGSTAGRAAMILCRGRCTRRRLGALERGEVGDDVRKLQVLVPLLVGFFLGTLLGACLHRSMGLSALLVPAAVTGTLGFVYMFFRTKLKAHIKSLEQRRLRASVMEMEEALERAHSFLSNQAGRPDQAPGAEEWAELDHQIEHALAVMHDVEATIAEEFGSAEPNLRRANTL